MWTVGFSRAYLAVWALLVLVPLAAGVWLVVDGWIPTADDAFLSMRARAVFSADPPLFSTASSAGAASTRTYNHPGPLALYGAAPFVALLGPSGVALGAAFVNSVSLAALGWVLRRVARPLLAAALTASVAGVMWAMGPESLASPWNPNQSTIPFLAAVVATWAVCCGALSGVPVAVLGASLAGQTHLSFTVPSVVLTVVVVAASVLQLRRRHGPARRRGAVVLAGSAAVAVLSVLPPLVDLAVSGSDSNIARLLTSSELAPTTLGLDLTVRFAASVLSLPPFFLGGSWSAPVFADEMPSTVVALVLLSALAAVVCGASMQARRDGDRELFRLLVLGSSVLLVGLAVATRFPLRLGVPVPYFRWMWPVAAVLTAGVVAAIVEWVQMLVRRPSPSPVPQVLLGSAVLAGLGGLVPASSAWTGSPEWTQPLARSLVDQVPSEVRGLGPVEVVATIQEAPLALTPVLMDQLDAAGVDVRSRDPVVVQQSGEHHRADGTERWRLVPVGPGAEPPRDGRRVAEVAPPGPSEAQVDRLVAEAAEELRRTTGRGSVPKLTPAGRRTGEKGLSDLVELITEDPQAAVRSRLLADALEHRLIEVPGLDVERVVRASRQATASEGRRVTWWLVPVDREKP